MANRIPLPPTPTEIRNILLNEVPRALLERTIRCIYGSWQRADLVTAELPHQVRLYLLPHVRRAAIEADWRSIGSELAGVRSYFRINRGHNAYYAKLICGRVALTESYVANDDDIPRPAAFRRELSQDNQLTLFRPLREMKRLYGIITHGRWRDSAGSAEAKLLPTFMRLIVPDPDYKRHIIDPIDLLAEFPETIRALNDKREELVADSKIVRLRDIARRKLHEA